MEDVEERALASYPFWKRFVDDTCTAIPPDHLESSITTLIPSNPQLSSLMKWKNRENCPSLTYSSNRSVVEMYGEKKTSSLLNLQASVKHKRVIMSTIPSHTGLYSIMCWS